MNKKLLELIQKKFEQALMAKTGWGRNDVLKVYQDCVNEALLEILDSGGA